MTKKKAAHMAKRSASKSVATAGKRQPKAKTAYELLQRVCEHIRRHPRAYYQGFWVTNDKEEQRSTTGGVTACGTFACRAGWIVLLNDGHEAANRPWSVRGRANEILGLTDYETAPVFDAFACDGHDDPGTPDYVREGVRGLREFMLKYAAHLKARSLRGV